MTSFTRQTLKKTVRKSNSDGRTYVYPHRLSVGPAARVREMKARLKIAIRYFDTMVGRRRAEMDPEGVVSLFGDHKLARGLIVAMARFYRYRRVEFAEVVPAEVAARLSGMGLGTPPALRGALFKRVNCPPEQWGFASEEEREAMLETMAEGMGLDGAALGELLWLDAEENWVLSRLATPDPADLLAIYDYLSLETMLRYAAKVELQLEGVPPAAFAETVRLLLDYYGLRGEVNAQRLLIHGRADALGSWARHGWRVVRLLLRLLALYPAALGAGEAEIELPNAKAVLRLDGEALALLGAGAAGDAPATAPLTPAAVQDLRRVGLAPGWRLRADPEPLVFQGGVIAPLLLCTFARRPFYVVSAAAKDAAGRIMQAATRLHGRAELIALVPQALAESIKGLPVLAYDPVDGPDLAQLVALLEKVASSDGNAEAEDEAQKALAELLNRVRREGFVASAAVAATLGDEPPQGALPAGRGVQSIPGFGLCSAGFLARTKEVIDDLLEYYGARIVTLRQVAESLALNIPRAEEAGVAALEMLIGALPEYVVIPRKLFEPYVRPLSRVTAGSVSAAAQAIGKAA